VPSRGIRLVNVPREFRPEYDLRMITKKSCALFLGLILPATYAFAQSGQDSVTYAPIAPTKAATNAARVTVAPVPLVTAMRTKDTIVDLYFRVASGFHINSNAPKSEFLIPTKLNIDVPTDMALGKTEYPPGQDLSFPFSPDEALNVYTGDFTVKVAVHPLKSVVPGKYVMHGFLRYQACDNGQCFPPKNLPVSFDVKVVKEPAGHHANPAQSPHVHN